MATMDFEETEWHSDVKTDTLVTSLFGTSCEKSKVHLLLINQPLVLFLYF